MAASLDSMWEGVDAVPPVQRDVLSKTRLTDWDLMRGLGEGEFAKVQACRRRGETVVRACKHISKQRLICQSNVKRTLRRVRRVGTEIEAMLLLSHPNICQLYDVRPLRAPRLLGLGQGATTKGAFFPLLLRFTTRRNT